MALALLLVACAGDPGVRTRSADVVDGPAPTVPTASPAPSEPTGTTEPPAIEDPGPDFTLPALTLPEPEPEPEPAPTTTGPPPTAGADDAPDDLASAGDSLYRDVGNDGLDVTHYVVRLDYDPDAAVIDGEVTISVTSARDVEQLVFDAVGLDVADVTIGGASAPFTTTDDELVVAQPLARGDEAELTVAYTAEPTAGGAELGLDAGWFATPTGSYVLNEPDGLRRWMPADDHPGDKATWRFELTVPDGLAGIANGEQQPSVDAGPDTTWVWEQREPMATYLVQVLTGDYEVVSGGAVDDVPLVHVAPRGDVDRMQPYFDRIAPQLEYFESIFGPYPLDRYGLAFTESQPGLAMETQGRSMFSAADFPGGPGGVGAYQDLLLSHELAHQWFGDAVSPADWGDLWLNESFATYAQWLWFDHVGSGALDGAAADALASRQRPTEPTGTPSVDNLFGLERYDGGAVVLHALRLEIGDDAFFTTLRRWAADNDGASRSTEDFVGLAEEVADRPLTSFFATWLFSPALPAAYPD